MGKMLNNYYVRELCATEFAQYVKYLNIHSSHKHCTHVYSCKPQPITFQAAMSRTEIIFVEMLLEANMDGFRSGWAFEAFRRRYYFSRSYDDFQNNRLRVRPSEQHRVERKSPLEGRVSRLLIVYRYHNARLA